MTAEGARARAIRIKQLRDAYRAVFLHPSSATLLPPAAFVLADLRRACCGDRTTLRVDGNGKVDALALAHNEGKRYVWLRLQQALTLEDGQLDRMITQQVENETW